MGIFEKLRRTSPEEQRAREDQKREREATLKKILEGYDDEIMQAELRGIEKMLVSIENLRKECESNAQLSRQETESTKAELERKKSENANSGEIAFLETLLNAYEKIAQSAQDASKKWDDKHTKLQDRKKEIIEKLGNTPKE